MPSAESAAVVDTAALTKRLQELDEDRAARSAALAEQIAAVRALAERVPAKVRVSLNAATKPAAGGRREHAT